jgi:transposase-like protein
MLVIARTSFTVLNCLCHSRGQPQILLVLFFPLGVWLPRNGAECSGSQRGRRSGAGFAPGSRSRCQTEAADLHSGVQTTHPRRSRSCCDDARGGLGALLRREGLYSSLLTYWRRERAQGILEALTPQKRGPKSKRNPMEEEVQKLHRQNARLTEDLRKAHIIIDVQKKVAALLGHPIPEQDPEEKS